MQSDYAAFFIGEQIGLSVPKSFLTDNRLNPGDVLYVDGLTFSVTGSGKTCKIQKQGPRQFKVYIPKKTVESIGLRNVRRYKIEIDRDRLVYTPAT
jgi:hypothetical protein